MLQNASPPVQYNLYPHQNQNSIKQQNAMKVPKIIPSLLFLVPILCMSPLIPGICAAAPVILLWMLLRLSLCNAKLSFTAYAWLSTESAMLWLLSSRRLSSSM